MDYKPGNLPENKIFEGIEIESRDGFLIDINGNHLISLDGFYVRIKDSIRANLNAFETIAFTPGDQP